MLCFTDNELSHLTLSKTWVLLFLLYLRENEVHKKIALTNITKLMNGIARISVKM